MTTQENHIQELRSQFKSLRRLYLLCLGIAALALILHFVDSRLSLALLGASLVLHLAVVRKKSKRYTQQFIHLSAQLTLQRHLDDARHTREPVLDPDLVRSARLLPANGDKGAVLCREGGAGLYHGRRVALGDVTMAHTFPVDAKQQHDFIVGCWVTVELERDTGLDCRFLGDRVIARRSLQKMLWDEPDLERQDPPAGLDTGWIVLCPQGAAALPKEPFLKQLDRLGKKTGGRAAVCVQRSRVHIMLVRQILGQSVSSRAAPGEGFQNVDLLPDLTTALRLTDYLA